MALTTRTLMDKGTAYILSMIHPRTLGRTGYSFFNGIFQIIRSVNTYTRADDMKELQQKNPTAWDAERSRRRWWRNLVVVSDVAILAILIKLDFQIPVFAHTIYAGPTLWILFHIGLCITVGRQEPIMTPVLTKRMAGESLLRTITDEMTLTLAQRKEGATSEIATPPHSLEHKRGYTVVIRVHQSGNPETLLTKLPTLAHKLRVGNGQVFTDQDPQDNSLIRMTVLKENPWDQPGTQHPLVANPRKVNLWREACDLGLHPDYSPWLKILATKGDGGGMLIGGAPRRGKSNLLMVLLIYIILDPMNNIHMIDGKDLDFPDIEPIATSYVGEDEMDDILLLRKALQVIESLKLEIARRKKLLKQMRAKHLTEELCKRLNLKLEWVFIDELAVITEDLRATHNREVQHFIEQLQYLVRMGPTFGIFCVLATQRPSDKSVPDSVRSLIITRISFYISSQPGSYAILGKAGPNYRADWLNKDQQGVALSVGDGQVRPHEIKDDELRDIVRYGMALRAGEIPESDLTFDWPEPVRSMISIFESVDATRLFTSTIIEGLAEREMEYTSVSLAKALKGYGVSPRNVRTDEGEAKGYRLEELQTVPKVVSKGVYTPSDPVSETGSDGLPVWLATGDQEDKDHG